MTIKVMTVRISEELAAELAVVARADDVPVSGAIRSAIHQYIDARMADPEAYERLKKRLDEDREIVDRLSKNI